MDLHTTYMGLELQSPVLLAACPISDDVGMVSRCVDAGAGAVVMRSLFEEQIDNELRLHANAHNPEDPHDLQFSSTVNRYLEQVSRLKDALDVPVIGSINGTTLGGWVRFAEMIQRAGADALELNVYYLATDPDEDPRAVEQRYLDLLSAMRIRVTIPLAIKLSPFFSAPVYMAKRLANAGAESLVLFNRFYQPDIDLGRQRVSSLIQLSTSSSLNLRLRWLAAIFGKTKADLACTGGVHTGIDALKAISAGASVVQMASAVLQRGSEAIVDVTDGMKTWMREHDLANLDEFRGSMSLTRCKDPAGLYRANYLRALHDWQAIDPL